MPHTFALFADVWALAPSRLWWRPSELSRGLASSLCPQFLEPMLTADLDFALILSGLGEIISKLHS